MCKVDLVRRWNVLGVVTQGDMTADERAVQHIRENTAAVDPDVLSGGQVQNRRPPGSSPLEGGIVAKV